MVAVTVRQLIGVAALVVVLVGLVIAFAYRAPAASAVTETEATQIQAAMEKNAQLSDAERRVLLRQANVVVTVEHSEAAVDFATYLLLVHAERGKYTMGTPAGLILQHVIAAALRSA